MNRINLFNKLNENNIISFSKGADNEECTAIDKYLPTLVNSYLKTKDFNMLDRENTRSLESGFVIWMTGLPGAGKTTISKLLERDLLNRSFNVEIIDGDEIRRIISPDLGFSREDRDVHARRIAYISKLLARNGVIVVVALISPFRATRQYAKSVIDNFVEVWIKCSVGTCFIRDPKGLYRKASDGKIKNFTGIDDPYEEPLDADITINTERDEPQISAIKLLNSLIELRFLPGNRTV